VRVRNESYRLSDLSKCCAWSSVKGRSKSKRAGSGTGEEGVREVICFAERLKSYKKKTCEEQDERRIYIYESSLKIVMHWNKDIKKKRKKKEKEK
jgi:hypothetical protein